MKVRITQVLRSGIGAVLLVLAGGCGGGDGPVRPDPEPPETPYAVEEVTFPSDGLVLRGTLYVPRGSSSLAGVVIVPGSGPVNRDGTVPGQPGLVPPAYKRWADLLAREGVAVLRYDKRFLTHSVDVLELSQEDQVRDVVAAVRHLRSRPEVDPGRVFILGHSEGGNLAPVAAGRDGGVRAVVSVGAPAFAVDSLLLEQLRASPAVPPEEVEEIARSFRLLREGRLPEDELILGVGPAYWREWIVYSQRADSIALGLGRPMRVVQGLADEAFPGATLARNVERWEAVASRSPLVELSTHAGVTHSLYRAGEEVAAEILVEIAEWFRTR